MQGAGAAAVRQGEHGAGPAAGADVAEPVGDVLDFGGLVVVREYDGPALGLEPVDGFYDFTS